MGRRPTIRNAILEVLMESENPLTYTEIKNLVEEKLNKLVYDNSYVNALSYLVENSQVEKSMSEDNSRFVYSLTEQYHKQSLKNTLTKIITKTNTKDIMELPSSFNSLPHIIFCVPKQEDISSIVNEVGMAEKVKWLNPIDGISSVLYNDFLLLPPQSQRGITMLVGWSYWAGVKCYSYEAEFPFINLIQRSLNFTKKILLKARNEGDLKRVTVEESLLQILEVSQNLIKINDLENFREFAFDNKRIIDEAKQTILSILGFYPGGGEKIFDQLVFDESFKVLTGLEETNLRKDFEKGIKPHVLETSEIWNKLFSSIVQFGLENGELKNIKGNLKESKEKIKEYSSYLNDLTDLFNKRKVLAIYLWNFPEIEVETRKCDVLPEFTDWYNALKEGYLDHRGWIFDDDVLEDLNSVAKLVNKGIEPENIIIDPQTIWTVKDLYHYHPNGKNPAFWYDLLLQIKKRIHHIQ